MRAMAFSPMPAALPRRAGAFALDYLLIAAWLVVVVGLGVLARAAVPRLAATIFSDPIAAEAAGFLLLTLPVGLYFALSEARPSGATWGKRRMGIGVVAAAGEPPSIGRSVLRTALKLLPWELAHGVIWRFAIPGSAPEALLDAGLVLVWILIGANLISLLVDASRRTLYDRLSGTTVVSSRG
jgi:uncharacterized RDD family membrane protein YckC